MIYRVIFILILLSSCSRIEDRSFHDFKTEMNEFGSTVTYNKLAGKIDIQLKGLKDTIQLVELTIGTEIQSLDTLHDKLFFYKREALRKRYANGRFPLQLKGRLVFIDSVVCALDTSYLHQDFSRLLRISPLEEEKMIDQTWEDFYFKNIVWEMDLQKEFLIQTMARVKMAEKNVLLLYDTK